MSHANVRGSLPAVLLGAMVVVALTAGCTASKRRQADQKLLEEIETASRLYARAVSLMDLAPAKVNGKYVLADPLARVGTDSTVELPAAMAVHPEAGDALAKAETGLTRVLTQYGRDAGDPEQALAQELLGNVLMLKAEYVRATVAADRYEARNTLAQVNRSATMVQLYASLGDYYERLSRLDDAALARMLSAARQEAAKAQADTDTVRQEIESLRARAEQLRKADEKLIPQARRLRVDSENIGGQQGMELLDQGLKLEREINENVSALAALENALERRQADLRDLTLTLESAQARQRVAETIVAMRKGHASASQDELTSIQTALVKARADVEAQTARLAGVCEHIGQVEDVAADAYTKAITRHEAARRLRGRDAQTTARLADARWALAELKDCSLYLREANVELAQRLADLWSPQAPRSSEPATSASSPATAPAPVIPVFAQGLLAYVPDPQQTRTEAAENFQQAGELYETAARAVPSQLRWAYQGQAAAAYIALYRLSHEPDALTKAKENLDLALADKRESPYLASVVELERLLQASAPRPERQSAPAPQ